MYVGCGMVVILLVFLYRAATSEMARLQELNVQCSHQQEALAAQLQVIFEYKVRLEKSLAEEKSSNAAVKQELQQRASREKSLREGQYRGDAEIQLFATNVQVAADRASGFEGGMQETGPASFRGH